MVIIKDNLEQFPDNGKCLVLDPRLINYLQTHKELVNSNLNLSSKGIAWNKTQYWGFKETSDKVEYKLEDLLKFLPVLQKLPEYVKCINNKGEYGNSFEIGKVYKTIKWDDISNNLHLYDSHNSERIVYYGLNHPSKDSDCTCFEPSIKEEYEQQNKEFIPKEDLNKEVMISYEGRYLKLKKRNGEIKKIIKHDSNGLVTLEDGSQHDIHVSCSPTNLKYLDYYELIPIDYTPEEWVPKPGDWVYCRNTIVGKFKNAGDVFQIINDPLNNNNFVYFANNCSIAVTRLRPATADEILSVTKKDDNIGLRIDECYHCKYGSSQHKIIFLYNGTNSAKYLNIDDETLGTSSWAFWKDSSVKDLRLATKEETEWLKQCINANKFVSKQDLIKQKPNRYPLGPISFKGWKKGEIVDDFCSDIKAVKHGNTNLSDNPDVRIIGYEDPYYVVRWTDIYDKEVIQGFLEEYLEPVREEIKFEAPKVISNCKLNNWCVEYSKDIHEDLLKYLIENHGWRGNISGVYKYYGTDSVDNPNLDHKPWGKLLSKNEFYELIGKNVEQINTVNIQLKQPVNRKELDNKVISVQSITTQLIKPKKVVYF